MGKRAVPIWAWQLQMSRDKMATSKSVNIEEVEERMKTPDQKLAKSPKTRGPSLKHKTRFPTETLRQSEGSLRQLLDDFEQGRLNAFGMCE